MDVEVWNLFRARLGAGKELGCKSPLSQTVESLVRSYLNNG